MCDKGEYRRESDFIQQRRRENLQAHNQLSNGLTPEAANALLKTRILDASVLQIVISKATSTNNPLSR